MRVWRRVPENGFGTGASVGKTDGLQVILSF
jgi:hypothetical protein